MTSGIPQWRRIAGRETLPVVIQLLRILLVDDSRDFLVSAAAFLCAQSPLTIVDTASSGAAALEFAARFPVDLVLLDLHMPGLNGFETTRRLKAGSPSPKVVFVTLQNAPEYRHIAQVVGADGFITKSEFTTALLPLIDSLFAVRNYR